LAFILTNLRTKESLIEAENHYKLALNIQRKFAPDFPEVKAELLKTLFALAELSAQFRNKDKFIQAEILYREVLTMLKTTPSLSANPDYDFVNIAVKIADILTSIGSLENINEAEVLLKEALNSLRKIMDKVPNALLYIAQIEYKLARALNLQLKQGKKEKLSEIEPLLDDAIAIYEAESKKNSRLLPNLGEYIFFLAASLHLYGPPEKYEKAESKYKETLHLFKGLEQTSEMKSRVLRVSSQLTELLDKMARVDDADISYCKSIQMARDLAELSPANLEYLGKLIYNYALFLNKNKTALAKEEEIAPLLYEAKKIFHKVGKEDLVKRVEETEKNSIQ